MNVVVMRGIPGSGKSTWIRQNHPKAIVYSADHYHIDKEGIYRFDPANAGAAHSACFNNFCEVLDAGTNVTMIVDNTNTRAWEISPYVAYANLFGVAIEIVRMECDPYLAMSRNVHEVPAKTVLDMFQALRTETLPPWWKETIVLTGRPT